MCQLLILKIPDFKVLDTLLLHIVICDLDYAYKNVCLNFWSTFGL
jgi:hypothetical protein